MAIIPRNVVSMTSRRLMPSMPRWYFAPIEGIQSAVSSKAKPPHPGLNHRSNGSETRKPSPPKRFPAMRVLPLARNEQQNERTHEWREQNHTQDVMYIKVHSSPLSARRAAEPAYGARNTPEELPARPRSASRSWKRRRFAANAPDN